MGSVEEDVLRICDFASAEMGDIDASTRGPSRAAMGFPRDELVAIFSVSSLACDVSVYLHHLLAFNHEASRVLMVFRL